MKKKIFWVDTEDSGTSPEKNGILQISGLMEIDDVVIDTINLELATFPDDEINDEALAVNGIDRASIPSRMPPIDAYRKLLAFLCKYCDKFDKVDKLVLAGKNIAFDDSFLRKFWQKCGDKYYGSMFFNVRIDVQSEIAKKVVDGLRLPNYKLSTLCEHFGIELKAHDAMSDIVATRRLYLLLTKK
jgi:DNA polymerase III epsilon subunit-like protein